jgi:8-oxo-dGTP pyrophosphatase MutT (NUDIX family)
VQQWTVAGAVLERDGELLLVCNRRRNGMLDWSTPGGVVDPEDESLLHGLTREVEEETGLRVTAWEGPLYSVTAHSLDLGWTMRCEVHRATAFEGDLHVDDPDGIVVEAEFVPRAHVDGLLTKCFPWVREPLAEWLDARWAPNASRDFHYDVRGTSLHSLEVVRTSTRV